MAGADAGHDALRCVEEAGSSGDKPVEETLYGKLSYILYE